MYFESFNSAKRNYGNQTQKILTTLIQRFIGANPEIPYNPVLDFPEQAPYDEKGWCHVSLNNFENITVGEKVLSTTFWPAGNDRNGSLVFKCYGPTTIYVNEELVHQTNPNQENQRQEFVIQAKLHKGWNKLSVITEKTPLGLGFQLRSISPQWDPVHFYQRMDYFLPVMGFANRKYVGNLEEEFSNQEKEDIQSTKREHYLVKISVPTNAKNFKYCGVGELFIDNQKVQKGKLISISHNINWLDLVYEGTELTKDIECIEWENKQLDWLYCGPIDITSVSSYSFETIQKNVDGQDIYWKAPLIGSRVRLARNSALFAHWTYWMGVTLYGFLEASTYFDKNQWKEYALASVNQIVKYDEYGLWDKKNYHYPLINTQFYWLKELDDCGSFGNLMLESLNYQKNGYSKKIARRIADFMENDVIRQSDQAFYRGNDTMWVDDLYMSIPFLTRYWEISQDDKYLDDAIQQFFLFQKRFFMADKKIMSHIYDTRFQKANGIPWSRGNGWVVFSLSELLNKLPKEHYERPKLVGFFNELIEGILAQQDQNGLWHQILDDPTTYSESSCTAMFICAISRSIRNGYLKSELIEKGKNSVNKAWEGLINYCVDKDGNLYGVCRGSGFSFSRDYYRSLGWALNDAHGIGIVALAGVEYEKLHNFM